jgi:hypothetical protein
MAVYKSINIFHQSLQRMNHPNIVKLKEVIRESETLFFVFEYMVRTIHDPSSGVVPVLVICKVTEVCVFPILGVQSLPADEEQGEALLRD